MRYLEYKEKAEPCYQYASLFVIAETVEASSGALAPSETIGGETPNSDGARAYIF